MTVRSSTFTIIAATLMLLFLAAWHAEFKVSGAPGAEHPANPDAVANLSPAPVLVELFTSEGCSSCPPADALLAQLARTQPVRGANVIVLEEHVDYWDRLGWKDPFSSEAATDRQTDYGAAFGGEQIYTPQMVVDGHAEFAGSSGGDALRAIRAASQAQKPAVQLSWQNDGALSLHIESLPNFSAGDKPEVFLAITESMLRSDVRRGENAGRSLEHDGVVRQLVPLGKISTPAQEYSSTATVHPAREWNRKNLRAVVFVQERHSRRILAVSAIPMPS